MSLSEPVSKTRDGDVESNQGINIHTMTSKLTKLVSALNLLLCTMLINQENCGSDFGSIFSRIV